jgi:hypothetical protein
MLAGYRVYFLSNFLLRAITSRPKVRAPVTLIRRSHISISVSPPKGRKGRKSEIGVSFRKNSARVITQWETCLLLQKMSTTNPNQKPNNPIISITTMCKNCGTEFMSRIAGFKSEHDFNISGFNQIEEDCPNCGKFSTYDKSDYYLLKK